MKPGILLMVRELHHGGSERQLTETALGMDTARFQPHVGAFRVEGIRANELRGAGIPIFRLPVHSFKSSAPLTSAWKLADYIRSNNIQLVHTFDMPLTAYVIPAVRMLTSAVALASQRCHLSLAGPYLRRFVQFAHQRAHGVVVNCECLQRHLVQDTGIPSERVYVCYNGIDLSRFRRLNSDRPAKLPPGALVIGTVGVLRPEKGLPTLLEAFAHVLPEAPNLVLLIVGSGPLLPELLAQAERLGISQACIFEPSTDRVDAWLQAIDIFVLPSLNEALSNALMEAMACGCFCVATNVGGNPELVQDGVRGLLYEPGNSAALAQKLQVAIANAELRQRMSQAAHDFVHAKFSREVSVRRMMEIYEKFLPAKVEAETAASNRGS